MTRGYVGSLLRRFFGQFINGVTYKWTDLAKLAAITLYDIIDIDLHQELVDAIRDRNLQCRLH